MGDIPVSKLHLFEHYVIIPERVIVDELPLVFDWCDENAGERGWIKVHFNCFSFIDPDVAFAFKMRWA